MQIESLSKRLDRKIHCKVEEVELPFNAIHYWRLVKRMPMKAWTALSPAQITLQVIDPFLNQVAETLNDWEDVLVGRLEVLEDDVVACFLTVDGQVPLRLLISPAGEDVIIVLDLLARPRDDETFKQLT